MRYCLIGTGFIFPTHIEAIKSVGGEIREVVNTARGLDDWGKVIEKTDADCIVILTPNDFHYPMAVMAAETGKIVLCEKPVAITYEQAKMLSYYSNIFTVLQLRHHPLVKVIQSYLSDKFFDIRMNISVYRDAAYHKSWKGQDERSGGILLNLGIHYFDLLLYLFGDYKKIEDTFILGKTGEGKIHGKNWSCGWTLSTNEEKELQQRTFKIDGVDYNFSSRDNLAYENLHKKVYQDLERGEGFRVADCLKAIELIDELKRSAKEL